MAYKHNIPLEKINDYCWKIPKSFRDDMHVDGIIYADEKLMASIREDKSIEQVANVACLPGIEKYSLAMPDIHWGYGFCIGGVAATDPANGGVISPGGVGYDINCGVRLLRSDIPAHEVRNDIGSLVDSLFSCIPCGVGQGGKVRFRHKELEKLLRGGSRSVVKQGFGWNSDVELTEAKGCLEGAEPEFVSERAYERGSDQCGTLGSGNHFLEIQVVDEIYDAYAASLMGLKEGSVAVLIHTGSRGLGYQVCEDSIKSLQNASQKYDIRLPDRQLACAPVHSKEGQRYLGAMKAAANFAWANRQILTHLTREAFEVFFNQSAESLGLHLVYDVAHNIAKIESHGGKKLCVHRKGATRAFPAGHPEVPEAYRAIGQPVLVPGDMGRYSYVLAGQSLAMEQTFGSCCHGAGRRLSRKAALKASKGRNIHRELLDRGVVARARGRKGLEEEQPDAYKDVADVVSVVHKAGIAKMVAKLRPLGVMKG